MIAAIIAEILHSGAIHDRFVNEASIEITARGKTRKMVMVPGDGEPESRWMEVAGIFDGRPFNYKCLVSKKHISGLSVSVAICEDPEGSTFAEFVVRDPKIRPQMRALWYDVGCWQELEDLLPIPSIGEATRIGDVSIRASCEVM